MGPLGVGTVWTGAIVWAAGAAAVITALLLVGCVLAETCVAPEDLARRQERLLAVSETSNRPSAHRAPVDFAARTIVLERSH